MKCLKCKEECYRESVDVGVGIIHGPYGCPSCGWSEDSEYDLSDGKDAIDEKGGVTDQWGCYWPSGNLVAMAYRHAKRMEDKNREEELLPDQKTE